MPARRQRDRDRGGDRGLAHSPLAHGHDDPGTRGLDLLDQRGQAPPAARAQGRGDGGAPGARKLGVQQQVETVAAPWGRPGSSGTVSTAATARSAAGILGQRLAARPCHAAATSSPASAAVKHPIEDQPLVGHPQGDQLARGARRLVQGGRLGASHQHQGGLVRIAEGGDGVRIAVLGLPERGDRADAGDSGLVGLQEARSRRREGSAAAACARSGRCRRSTWSYAPATVGSASRATNSLNAAISTVQEPESSSSI